MGKQYNSMIYSSRPVKFDEFMTNKYNIVHKQLYDDAMDSLIEYIVQSEDLYDEYGEPMSVSEFKRKNKCIEIKEDEYWKSPRVIIIRKQYPYKKTVYDLAAFWSYIQSKDDKNIDDIKVNKDIKDFEITKLDYLKGQATLHSRLYDEDQTVDFDYIDDFTKVSDELELKSSFITRIV